MSNITYTVAEILQELKQDASWEVDPKKREMLVDLMDMMIK